jgi:hypothetical protein
MALLAHSIRFDEPGSDFAIDLIHALEPKCMEMISRRKSLDSPETRVFQAARQDDMAIHPFLANHKRRKTHADLKCDPRLFGQDDDRAVLPGYRKQLVEDDADGGRFTAEMGSERVTAARVRLIPVRECPAAALASPKPP